MMTIDEIELYLSQKNCSLDDSILKIIQQEKAKAQNEQINCLANKLWGLETVFSIQSKYLSMFANLKAAEYDKYFTAWHQLETIAISIASLLENTDYPQGAYNIAFIEKELLEYEKLFPYEYFSSRESVIKKSKCSICGSEISLRNRCQHRIGKVYMGELCLREITESEILGIAIVKHPFDKYAVIFPEGVKYNYSVLEALMPRLHTPYDSWTAEIQYNISPQYLGTGRNSLCPCGSGIKYKKCCLGTEKELVKHHKIVLDNNPSAKPLQISYLGNALE